MRKNYILALLASGVLPMSAFAAIDIPGVATDKGSWDLSGVSNVQTGADGMITVPGAQGGYPACTIKDLPAGEYVISGTLKNAGFVVKLNGVEVKLDAKGIFKTTTAGNLVIEVNAVDKSASYSFGDVKLALNVDLAKIQSDLNALMPTKAVTAPSDNMAAYVTDEVNGADVMAEYDKIMDPTALQEAIDAVNPAGATPEKQLEAYMTYVKNDVEAKVKAYAKAVSEYENGIQDEKDPTKYTKYPIGVLNGWANTLAANKTNHDDDNKALDSQAIDSPGYNKKLEDLVAEIKSTGHEEALAKQIKAVKDAIAAARTQIEENWDADGVQSGKADYDRVDMQPIENALTALTYAYSALLNDENRYEKLWLPDYQKLTNAYINAQQAIKDIYAPDYKDYENTKARQDSVMAAVTKIYNEAVNRLQVKYGDGVCTDDQFKADDKVIETTIHELQARTDKDSTNLANEKKALAAGTDLVDGLYDAFGKVKIAEDAYDKTGLETEQAALKAEIKALQDKITGIYDSTEVLTDDYITGDFQKAVDATQAKVDAFDAKVAVANQLGALTTSLNEERDKIATDDNNIYLKGLDDEYKVDVVDMMSGSYDSIMDAIEQQQGIYDEDYTKVVTSALKAIETSINNGSDSYLANGIKMAKDFSEAYRIAIPDLKAANDLVVYIDKNNPAFNVLIKSSLPEVGVDVKNNVDQGDYKLKAKGYQTTAQNIVKGLKAARTMTPQNAFDAIEAVMADIKAQDLAKNIPATKLKYLQDVIGSTTANSNIAELKTASDYIAAEMTDITSYAGYDMVKRLYDLAKTRLDKVEADFAAAANPADLEKVNAAAKDLLTPLQGVQREIDKVVKNYNAYQNILGQIQKVVDAENGAITFAEENAYKPAQDTWIDLVKENVKKAQDLETKGNDALKALDTVYGSVDMLTEVNGVTNEQAYAKELKTILDWFGQYEKAVKANETAHNTLLDESAVVTGLVDEVNTYVKAAEVPIILENGDNAADVLKGYIDELSDLDTYLYNVYKDVNCVAEEADLMAKYEELRGKINDLYAQLEGDYAKALKDYNENFIAKKWSGFRAELMQTYTQAVINLDEYQDAADSCPALAENADIQEGVDHQPVYQYAPKIQDLLKAVTKMCDDSWKSKVDGKDHQPYKLTDDHLAKYIDQAETIIAGILSTYGAKVEKINDAAESILSGKQAAVDTRISEAETTLTDAGCDKASIEKALKGANDAVEQATDIVNDGKLDGTEKPNYVTGIAEAINILDGVDITDAELTQAAVNTFNTAVKAVEKALAKAQETLDKSNLPENKKAKLQQMLDEANDDLDDCRDDKITLENLKDELAKLDAIGAAGIQEAIDQAIKDNKANEDNNTALNKEVTKLQKSLNDLNNWVEQLLVAADVPTTALQAEVTNMQDIIDAAYEKGELKSPSKKDDLQSDIDDLQKKIDDMYAEAYQRELKRLNDVELLEAKRAYNEAAKSYEEATGESTYPDTDEGKAFTQKIAEQAVALGTAATVIGTPTEAQQQAIVDIQSALLNIQIDLNYLTVDQVLASLDEAAENAIVSINASKKAQGNYAAQKYGADYDALVAEVEALQQEWNANKSTVIVKEGVYLSDISQIVKEKLVALDKEAADYQAEREANAAIEAASDAAYDRLNAKLDKVRQSYYTTAGYIKTYGKYQTSPVDTSMDLINGKIVTNQNVLDEAKDDFTCVDFSWVTPLSDINDMIEDVNGKIWKSITNNLKGDASLAIAYARKALNNDKNHVGADGFAAALDKLDSKYRKLVIVTNGDAKAGVANAEAALQIIADAEALFQSILDAEYIAGDITGTGEVTTDDYEALIELLGQIEDSEDFDNPAYDVNGDGSVTMADINSIIDILMGRTSDAAVMARMPMVTTNNAIYVVKTGTANGITRYAVMLNNSADLFGAQMDIMLSDGMEIVSEGLAERTSNNEFYGSTTYSGNHRIILSSIEKSAFAGSEGAVVYIDVRGEGELNINNVYGVDVQGRMYNINVMSNVSGIESISIDGKNADIYNVGGQKLNRTERGVNIIRTQDGKASKVLKK